MKIDVAMMFLFSLENISCEMIISFMDKRQSKHDSQTILLPLPKLKRKIKSEAEIAWKLWKTISGWNNFSMQWVYDELG